MYRIILYNLHIAMEAIGQNKLRAALTSLGIIFGVGSVIAMLAIGKGAQEEILEKMKLLGTNNIIIKTKEIKKEAKVGEDESNKTVEKNKYTPGMTLDDANSIKAIVPTAEAVSAEMSVELTAISEGFKQKINLIGVDDSYFNINPTEIKFGSLFTKDQLTNAIPVCVIGGAVKTKFFPACDPIGKYIKCGNIWLKVVGSLSDKQIKEESIKSLGIRNYNFDIYTPINTALLRFRNRNLITKQTLKQGNQKEDADKESNQNQVDRIVVKINDSQNLKESADIIKKILARKHNYVEDYEVIVPEELLKQEQKTRSIFNIVLGSIASISLLVGGIGIMNIMLASVMERIKEIGTRLAVGAKKHDIVVQFLCESVSISLVGGILGIFFGVGLSYGIEMLADIKTIVSGGSVALSFFVSITIGILFGIMPAKRAAQQNPIESLRYE